jgi:flagellar FliJ protein
MSAMNGLELALSQALDRRDAVAQVVAHARQAWINARAQLDQLDSYASECTDRWAEKQSGCIPEIMRHHYQFMARLTHAIGLQTGIVADHAHGVERQTAALREAEARLESLRQLTAARTRGLQQALDRREQKQSDEFAALQYRRQREQQASANTNFGGGF